MSAHPAFDRHRRLLDDRPAPDAGDELEALHAELTPDEVRAAAPGGRRGTNG